MRAIPHLRPFFNSPSPCFLLCCFLWTLFFFSTNTSEAAPSGCVEIKHEWPICGGLAGKFIDIQMGTNLSTFTGVLTSKPATGTGLTDEKIIELNLATFFDVDAPMMPNGVNLSFTPTFKALHGCPNYTHYHRRYLYSMWCIALAYSSTRCNSPVPPLCRDTCEKYVEGTLQTLKNTTQCPPGSPSVVSYDQTIQSFASVCDKPVFNGGSANCISGDTIEPGLCGYFPNARECDPRTCPPNAPLCAMSVPSTPSSSKTNYLMWVGVGAFVAGSLLIVGGLIFYYYRRSKQKKRLEKPMTTRPVSKRISSMLPSMAATPSTMSMSGGMNGDGDVGGGYMMALRDYVPTLNDELELREGDVIKVIQEFDDGWCKAFNETTAQQGVCPLTFLGPYEEYNEGENGSRMSRPYTGMSQQSGASRPYTGMSEFSMARDSTRFSNSVQQPYRENIAVNKLRARETTMKEDDD